MRSKVRKKNYDNLVGGEERRVIGGHHAAEVHQLFWDFFLVYWFDSYPHWKYTAVRIISPLSSSLKLSE
jgi:hypothetical protein